MEGGLSAVSSSVRVHNRLVRECPDLASRPPHVARRSHWEANRSASRLRPGSGA